MAHAPRAAATADIRCFRFRFVPLSLPPSPAAQREEVDAEELNVGRSPQTQIPAYDA